MKTALITPEIPPFTQAVTLSPESAIKRDELIAKCKAATETPITTAEQAAALSIAWRDLQTHIKQVEEDGMDLRRPWNLLCKQITAAEKAHIEPLLPYEKTMKNMTVEYDAREKARIEAEEKARAAEIARLERERIAAEEKARKEFERVQREAAEAEAKAKREAEARAAEAARIEAEAREKEKEIVTDPELQVALQAEQARRAALAETERLEAEAAEQRRQEKFNAELAAIEEGERKRAEAELAWRQKVVAPSPEANKVAGASVRKTIQHKLLDGPKLFALRPELFKPLELKSSVVNQICIPKPEATETNPDTTSHPHLAVWWKTDASVRKW